MATERLTLDGEELLSFSETLEYINDRRGKPIKGNTLRSYIARGDAGMPAPDKRVANGRYSTLFYKASTLDGWLASRRSSTAGDSGTTD